jgi:hypothetical protein
MLAVSSKRDCRDVRNDWRLRGSGIVWMDGNK